MDKKNKILNAKNLSIGYCSKKEETIIANNLNFELNKGELICLLGKNGIGKSTLLRTLTKMQTPISGNIFLNHENIHDLNSNDLAKKISIVLTEKIPTSNLTVYELIALGRQPYTNWLGNLSEEDMVQINHAIELSKLESLKNKKCDELSDGQLQKVMICRALAQNTDIIILDEPTAHLDIQHKIETFQLLKKLALEQNKTILISTHEIQLALQTASRLFLMIENNFVIGNPDFLIENGSIDLLFDNDTIKFDKINNQFKIDTT